MNLLLKLTLSLIDVHIFSLISIYSIFQKLIFIFIFLLVIVLMVLQNSLKSQAIILKHNRITWKNLLLRHIVLPIEREKMVIHNSPRRRILEGVHPRWKEGYCSWINLLRFIIFAIDRKKCPYKNSAKLHLKILRLSKFNILPAMIDFISTLLIKLFINSIFILYFLVTPSKLILILWKN